MIQTIIIPNIQLHNANAISSPYTIGFPAMTAWLGWMHNLQRHLNQTLPTKIQFKGIAVSCHDIKLHTHKDGFKNYIIGTSNPLNKVGKRPSFIEEGRADLNISIAIEIANLPTDIENKDIENEIKKLIYHLKMASGDVIKCNTNNLTTLSIESTDEFKKLTARLMPGYCLVSRQDLVTQKMQQGKDAIDAILDHLIVQTNYQKEKNKFTQRTIHKKESSEGWIVPIPIGYQGLTPLQTNNQTNDQIDNPTTNQTRDQNTPHRFAESILSLGEFKMPYQLEHITQLFWYYPDNIENDLYLCKNDFPNFINPQNN